MLPSPFNSDAPVLPVFTLMGLRCPCPTSSRSVGTGSLDLEQEADPLNVDHFSCTPLVSARGAAGGLGVLPGEVCKGCREGRQASPPAPHHLADVGLCPGPPGSRCAPLPLEQTGAEHSRLSGPAAPVCGALPGSRAPCPLPRGTAETGGFSRTPTRPVATVLQPRHW